MRIGFKNELVEFVSEVIKSDKPDVIGATEKLIATIKLEYEQLKAYVIHFKGCWVGGVSVVMANNKNEAIQLLRDALMSDEDANEKAREIYEETVREFELNKPSIVLYDNGDY